MTATEHHWHAWIAENLVLGSTPPNLVASMVNAGVDRESAERSVNAALEHPYLRGARTAATAISEKRAEHAAALGPAGGDARTKKYAWFLEVARRAARQSAAHGSVARDSYGEL